MAKKKEESEVKFTKDQLIKAKKFSDVKDAINAILEDGKEYTIEEAVQLLHSFMEGEK